MIMAIIWVEWTSFSKCLFFPDLNWSMIMMILFRAKGNRYHDHCHMWSHGWQLGHHYGASLEQDPIVYYCIPFKNSLFHPLSVIQWTKNFASSCRNNEFWIPEKISKICGIAHYFFSGIKIGDLRDLVHLLKDLWDPWNCQILLQSSYDHIVIYSESQAILDALKAVEFVAFKKVSYSLFHSFFGPQTSRTAGIGPRISWYFKWTTPISYNGVLSMKRIRCSTS